MVRTLITVVCLAVAGLAHAQDADGVADAAAVEGKPEPIRRPGSVDLHETYDMQGLGIPEDEIHTLLPRDAIPALTDPETEPVAGTDWMTAEDRVLVVTIGKESVATPLRILNWHEVVNMTVGGEPVAATYCPLCDSATVVSRRNTDANGNERVLELGVSGALYNSNVLMYDRTDMALWSQLGMQAVSGPIAGATLDHYPAQIVSWGAYVLTHPDGRVVTRNTGHERDYDDANPYRWFFDDPDRLLVPVQNVGDALPPKTLGVGIKTAGGAWFVPVDVIGDEYTLRTDLGDVDMTTSDAGVSVTGAPDGVSTAQTFYYSWSAFNPDTRVVSE